MANVTFTAHPQPAPACYPPDVNALLQLIATGGLSGTIPDTAGGGIYVGSIPPSSSLTNKVWFKVDAAGRPLGVFMYYNGNWRKIYTGIGYGEIRMYVGSPTVFDGTGRGVVGGDFDGWALCNGNNGTPNLEAYFMVGGQWSGSQWITDTDGVAWRNSGGAKGPQYINRTKLPKLTSYAYGRIAAAAGSDTYVVANAGQLVVGDWPVIDFAGNPVDGVGQQPISLPLYYAVAYMMFIGYA